MANVVDNTKSLSAMRNFVYFLINESSDDFPAEDVNKAINTGLAHVFEMTDESFAKAHRTVSVGTREYDIAEAKLRRGLAVVQKAWITDLINETQTELSLLADYDLASPTDEDATPTSYYINGDNIGLVPTPDAAYKLTILYQKEIPELSEDSSTVEMSDIQVQAALYYAAYLMKVRDEELAMANYFKNMCDEELGKLAPNRAGVYKYDGAFNA